MSTATLITEKLAEEAPEGPLSSTTPTPVRTSLDNPIKDEEKLSEEEAADDPPPLSTARVVLLMLGLCLSMFLVALDFVSPDR